MGRIHLIADDLTGALDSAVAFAGSSGSVPVHWRGGFRPSGGGSAASLAIDSGTRELGRDEARAAVSALVAGLPRDAGAIRYAKLDSLLRGHPAAEIAAWIGASAEPVGRCVVAPAFPFHGRVTRGGRQFVRQGEELRPTGPDLAAELWREGLEVRLCRPGDDVPAGVSLWDAETDGDLAAIVRAGRASGAPVLWCGSGGLAAALADPAEPAIPPELPRPLLGLFGTDHPVTRAQLAACAPLLMTLPDGGPRSAAALSARLATRGVALALLALPDGVARAEAARRIDRELGALIGRLDRPGTLLVSGGETLRGLCRALDAERLDLDGRLLSGVPCSVLRGGRFDGVRVVSKSGAFGDPLLLRRLLLPDAGLFQGDHA